MRTPNALRSTAVAVAAVVVAVAPAGPAMAATWSVTTTPHPASAWASRLTGVDASSTTDAWAVGAAEYGSAPAVRPITARWNGAEWAAVPTPVPDGGGALAGVATGPGGTWAVGSAGAGTLIQRWTGSAWSVVPSPSPAGARAAILHDVTTFGAGDAWAVGQADLPGVSPARQTLIERWNGTSWRVVPSPNPDPSQNLLSAVDGVAADDVWAVGGMGHDGYGGQPVAGLILHWNGSAWTRSAIPAHPTLRVSELRDVVAVAADDVWAVGVGFSWQRFGQVAAILHWNGQAWQHVAAPSPGDSFDGVTALSPTKVYAVGTGAGRAFVARWNGSTWSAETTPSGGWPAAAAAAGGGSVWVVGLQTAGSGSSLRTYGIHTGNG